MNNHCKKSGVEVVPQKAFDRFNVDLYLPKYNVVIEIFGGGFHNKKDAVDLFNNKIKHLSNKKVPVLIVWADKLTYDPKTVLKIAKGSKEPIAIINGDGTSTTRGINDIII
jgi:very-short-patch-repair endonuclease